MTPPTCLHALPLIISAVASWLSPLPLFVCDAEKPSGLHLSPLFIISAITVNAGSPSLLLRVCECVCVHACMCGQALRSNTA